MAEAMRVIDAFPGAYRRELLQGQRAKLGLRAVDGADDGADAALADDWLALLEAGRIDFTLAWRRLADAAAGDEGAATVRALLRRASAPRSERRRSDGRRGRRGGCIGGAGAADVPVADALPAWLARWRERCAREDEAPPARCRCRRRRAARMRGVNPWIIPRNHRVEEALAAASDDGDLAPFDRLLAALRRPYDESAEDARYAEPAPAEVTAGYRTFCGT